MQKFVRPWEDESRELVSTRNSFWGPEKDAETYYGVLTTLADIGCMHG